MPPADQSDPAATPAEAGQADPAGQTRPAAPVPILMYHQVAVPPPSGTPMRGMVVGPAAFARQMRFLAWLGYRGLSLGDLEPYLAGEKRGRVVGLTFDDGYANVLENAMPVLRGLGFTATCYAVSGRIGGSNAWDHALGVPPSALMTEAQWREWLAGGMEMGAHGRHHLDLTAIGPEQAVEEIEGAKLDLEARFGAPVLHFCYPYGRHAAAHRDLAMRAGYRSATTVRRGRVHAGSDPFQLPRVLVAQATHLGHFALKVLTAYEDRRGWTRR